MDDDGTEAGAPDDPDRWPLGRLLSAAARRVEQDWDRSLASIGLTHGAVVVLHHLVDGGPTGLDELARAVRVTPQTMSKTLDRMQRDGLVERTASDLDRRRKTVTVTDLGRDVWLRAHELEAGVLAVGDADAALRRALVGIVIADRRPRPDDRR